MELQFQKSEVSCLRQIKCQVQHQEQTAQIRLDDTVAAVRKVLCTWGQVLLRGKQWRSDAVQVNGGVNVWVMYTGEDGADHWTQTWVPVQIKMDIAQTQLDGTVMADLQLRSVDARSINERKLMVRVDVAARLCATVPESFAVYSPDQLPDCVQLLQNTYPVRLPMEVGEKPFSIDEILTLPGTCPPMERILCYRLQPEIIDRKVMADKVVFRGMGLLHMLYKGTDGQIYSWDFELPFSQYDQLTGQYDQTATTRILPAVTSLELEHNPEGQLQVKAGLVGQYMIFDRRDLPLVQDAYSTDGELTLQTQQLEVPAVLDMQTHTENCRQKIAFAGGRVVDVMFLQDQPVALHGEQCPELDLGGRFRALCVDEQGEYQVLEQGWSAQLPMDADASCALDVFGAVTGMPVAAVEGEELSVQTDLLLDTAFINMQSVPMVAEIALEPAQKEQEGPALILRRAGNESLWQMAKETGSTVDKIRSANSLTGEPEPGRMLLIPVV